MKITFRSFMWTCSALCLSALLCAAYSAMPQERVNSQIRVMVELVQLNVAVTDSKGEYVTGLQPSDFTVLEDGISQKLATFAEGNEPTRKLEEGGSSGGGASTAKAENEHPANQPDDANLYRPKSFWCRHTPGSFFAMTSALKALKHAPLSHQWSGVVSARLRTDGEGSMPPWCRGWESC